MGRTKKLQSDNAQFWQKVCFLSKVSLRLPPNSEFTDIYALQPKSCGAVFVIMQEILIFAKKQIIHHKV